MSEINAPLVASLLSEAEAIGVAWAEKCANDLRASKRGVIGGWPGTLREARRLVMARLPAARARPTLDADTLQALARATNEAARKSWQAISEPDPEG